MARTEEEDERNRCNTARSSKNAAFLRKKKLDSTSREPFRIDSRSWSVITKKDRRKIRGSFIFHVLGEGACGAAFSRAAFKVFLFFFGHRFPKKRHTHTHLASDSRRETVHFTGRTVATGHTLTPNAPVTHETRSISVASTQKKEQAAGNDGTIRPKIE